MALTPNYARASKHCVSAVGVGMLSTNGLAPYVFKSANEICDWNMDKGDGRTEIRLLEGGGYLGCKPDAEGKDKGTVILVAKTGKGTEWEVKSVPFEKGGFHTIQATQGNVKGWYLCVGEKGEDFTDGTGKKVKSYRVYLSEKATKHSRWRLTEISP